MTTWSTRLAVLHDRNFRLFYIGYTLSLLGTGMEAVGVSFAVLDGGGSAGDLSVVLIGGVAANMLCMLAGGAVADRFGWRLTMLASDTLRFFVVGLFAFLVITGDPPLWLLVVLYVIQNIAYGFYTPALFGLTQHLVREDQLHEANVLIGLSRDFGRVAGPAIAGVIVVVANAGAVLAVDAATFGISAASLALLRLAPFTLPKSQSMLHDLRDGWSAWRSHTWIWLTSLRFSISNALVIAPFIVLGPAVANASLGGADSWGIILAAQGAGAVLAGPLILRWKPKRPLLAITLVPIMHALPALGLALLLSVPLLAAAAFLAGIGSAAFNAVFATTMQRTVPSDMISRVMAYSYLTAFALSPLGLAAAASVSGEIGAANVFWIAAGWQVLSTLFLAALPAVRTPRDSDVKRDKETAALEPDVL